MGSSSRCMAEGFSMIGDYVYIGEEMYVVVNDQGTIEDLPHVGFWRECWIEIRHNFKPWKVAELRKYCNEHNKGWIR